MNSTLISKIVGYLRLVKKLKKLFHVSLQFIY
jgi:hypothetical protein